MAIGINYYIIKYTETIQIYAVWAKVCGHLTKTIWLVQHPISDLIKFGVISGKAFQEILEHSYGDLQEH